MNLIRIIAIALIVLGVLGLVYNHFSYTKDSQQVNLGPLNMTVKEKQNVDIPTWAGVASITAGVVLLLIMHKDFFLNLRN